jgi:hypothetical protein
MARSVVPGADRALLVAQLGLRPKRIATYSAAYFWSLPPVVELVEQRASPARARDERSSLGLSSRRESARTFRSDYVFFGIPSIWLKEVLLGTAGRALAGRR